jgi:glycogen operon protein
MGEYSPAVYQTRPGSRFPPGATAYPHGVNFCIYSRHATRVELLLYAGAEDREPCQTIALAGDRNRSFSFWHVFVEALPSDTCYAWRVDGPDDTAASGHRFNPRKLLLDPWARAVSDAGWDRRRAADPADSTSVPIRGLVSAAPMLPRGLTTPRSLEGAIIYELHVGGYTRHPSSGVEHPGTFSGLIEKIPYLQELGVTHVELLPVMAYDEQDVPARVAERGLCNFWGYSTHSYCAVHPRYCVDPLRAVEEFRELTAALQKAGIGVLLDVVYNHTAEGGQDGPTISFKGFANDMFYHLDDGDRRRYRDYTGCGNTVNCNHPLVTAFILHSLEYWVEQMGVSGFRFDLASVFARDGHGALMSEPPLPWAIESSRTIAPLPLIAEAWDAAGLYHVGAFPGMAWTEWNGRYRDVIRRFVRGDAGLIGEIATRLGGSSDLYSDDGRRPANSINFVTCHDGFTLWDLVSYDHKRNLDNAEDNRDGTNDNASWGCGVDGPTEDPAVLALRRRQARNHLALLMLSRGVPMLLGGDEILRSQGGNNNAWCQDNAVSWLDWTHRQSEREMLRYTRELIALRKRHPCLTRNQFFDGRPVPGRALPDVSWHGARLGQPDWRDPSARLLAATLAGAADGEADLHLIFNMSDETVEVQLPAIAGRTWRLALDTSRASPEDIVPPERQRPHEGTTYRTAARTVAVLEAWP